MYANISGRDWQTYKQFCNLNRIKYKSIFINNPWGVLEGKKLNYYLIKSWFEQRKTIIKYPLYIRDNINIEQLSKKYNKIVLSKSLTKEYYPTGYCSSNKVFVEALRGEFEKFFKIKTKVKYLKNSKYNEPLIRTNSKKITKKVKFKEKLDDYFKYYYDLFIFIYFAHFRRRGSIARAPPRPATGAGDLRFRSGGTSPILFPQSGCSHTLEHGYMYCWGV